MKKVCILPGRRVRLAGSVLAGIRLPVALVLFLVMAACQNPEDNATTPNADTTATYHEGEVLNTPPTGQPSPGAADSAVNATQPQQP